MKKSPKVVVDNGRYLILELEDSPKKLTDFVFDT